MRPRERGRTGSNKGKGKGAIVKTSAISSILLSTLFYTTLLSTTFVMPLLLATHANGVATTRDAPQAQEWERSVNAPAALEQQRSLRMPQTDVPVSDPAAKQAPADKSGPDAEMIKPGKVREKTIKA